MENNIIKRIAYRIYQDRERQGIVGNDKTDWQEAEMEFMQMKYCKAQRGDECRLV